MTNEFETEMPDMEALWGTSLEDQKADEAEKSLLAPNDTYISTPPLAVTVFLSKKDGRPLFSAFGHFVGRKEQKQIRQSIQFSPDVRTTKYDDGNESLDRPSKNYLQLRRAYQKVYGSLPGNVGDLKTYLEQYPLGFRGGSYERKDTGETVFGIFQLFAVTA